jgi:hypothetical protein
MHFTAPLCIGLIAASVMGGPAWTQNAGDPLRLYAVRIGGGHGIYLGSGIVITAAHVAGTEPRVELAGHDVPAKVLKQGDPSDVDLTLLSIDGHLPARLGLHHLLLCQNQPVTGEPVLVAIPEGVARSYVMAPSPLPPDLAAKFRTVIRYIDAGDSGSGVFDAKEKCLLGIISRKITVQFKPVEGHEVAAPRDIAKYFVPASEIAKFIPPEVHF